MRYFGKLSGWQITAVVCAALTVPSALYAVTYSDVALINPNTGTPAVIDALGTLHTTDIFAQYRDNPANKVDIRVAMTSPDTCQAAFYTIPAGKALIITAISGNFYNSDATIRSGFWVTGASDCSGAGYISQYVPVPPTAGAIVEKNYQYGSGVAVPAGAVSFYGANDGGWTVVHGYLVPASLVSANSYQMLSASPAARTRSPRGG